MEGASEARTMVAMTEKATVLVPAETRVVTATSYGSSLRAPSRLYLRAHKTFKRQQELAVRQGGARMWTWVGACMRVRRKHGTSSRGVRRARRCHATAKARSACARALVCRTSHSTACARQAWVVTLNRSRSTGSVRIGHGFDGRGGPWGAPAVVQRRAA